jgi:hypothetical protein
MHFRPKPAYDVGDISDQANALLRSSNVESYWSWQISYNVQMLTSLPGFSSANSNSNPRARNIIASQFLKPTPPLKLRQSQSPSGRDRVKYIEDYLCAIKYNLCSARNLRLRPNRNSHSRGAAGPKVRVNLPRFKRKPFLPKHEQRTSRVRFLIPGPPLISSFLVNRSPKS